ncbi:endonuclease/exonuclease/phosphatase family protein [Thalassotalea crassostreae]|uniref:endonuclease/exonuclease/phosphatase family protein n=1 Tax=Thalassotalea crassostreae TaxID=1763536 RepID=UPI0012FDEA07|nr:endonuclease/exonuclease/phosphatase family protein [Thalassotalea crassostreae]
MSGIFTLFSLSFLGFNLSNINILDHSSKQSLTILSANLGGGGKLEELQNHLIKIKPDIVALQEANKQRITDFFEDDWNVSCSGHLCTLSRYPLEKDTSLQRNSLGGWGVFLLSHSIIINDNKVNFANIHLDTPRSALTGLLYADFDTSIIKEVDDNRTIEAGVVKAWVNKYDNVVLAGDFNMPIDENIYHQNFNTLENAIDVSSSGFNYTKFTKWHGIRIDHILFTKIYDAVSSDVLNDVGGDHHPVVATLAIKTE